MLYEFCVFLCHLFGYPLLRDKPWTCSHCSPHLHAYALFVFVFGPFWTGQASFLPAISGPCIRLDDIGSLQLLCFNVWDPKEPSFWELPKRSWDDGIVQTNTMEIDLPGTFGNLLGLYKEGVYSPQKMAILISNGENEDEPWDSPCSAPPSCATKGLDSHQKRNNYLPVVTRSYLGLVSM